MKTRPGICAGKRRYASEAAAWAAVEKAAAPLRVYRCALCRHWHLTSRTKGLRVPPARRPQPTGL